MSDDELQITTADMLEIVVGGGNGVEYVDVCGLIETAAKELRQKDAEITRLRADLTAALAECERLNKSRNRWGKKYNDCLGKLRLAVMSDSDYVKEIDYQNTRLLAENERLREALKPFAAEFSLYKTDFPDHFYISDLGFTFGQLRAAAAALERSPK